MDNKYIIASGCGSKENHKKCEIYDVTKNDWKDLPDMITGRYDHSSCVFKNKYFYVFSGNGSYNDDGSQQRCIERLLLKKEGNNDEI